MRWTLHLVLLVVLLSLGASLFEDLFGDSRTQGRGARGRSAAPGRRDRASRRREVIEDNLLSFLLLECEAYLAEKFGSYDEDELSVYLREKQERDAAFVADLVDVYGVTEVDVERAGETALAEVLQMMRDRLEGLVLQLRTEIQEGVRDLGGMPSNDTVYEEEDVEWS